ncbi:MAG TPA: class I SAM-dependent methyltransferase [Puia sp.]|nr:class I SAM-dependent methyltransferase [Puia sp.]
MTIQQALTLISPATSFLATQRNPQVTPSSDQPLRWADLGCGSGLFTTALSQLLLTGSTIYGVDMHPTLRRQTISPTDDADNPTSIIPIEADFVKDPLDLPPLDGILMANSLHYVKDKTAFIQKVKSYMRPDSPFIIVEYDTDTPVPTWVPYPVGYDSLTRLFKDHTIQKLGERPSTYGRANMYAALVRPS